MKRLEQQMALEDARDDYDGASVSQVITEALGAIKESSARGSLLRKLERLAAGKGPPSDASDVAYALWRKRHPELIPVLRVALEKLPSEETWALKALLRLLEMSPEGLAPWVRDTAAPLIEKRKVLTLLDQELPDELIQVFPAFISTGNALRDAPLKKGDAAEYCDRLFITLLLHRDRVLPALPDEARAELRTLARRCLASRSLNCSSRAARILQYVGRPEDASLIEANRPKDPSITAEYDEAARVLRNLPRA